MRKFKYIWIWFFLISADLVDYSMLQQKNDTHAKLKAIYIYNFTRYFEWPSTAKSGNFNITLLGENANLVADLQKISGDKVVGGQKIEIHEIKDLKEVENCQILFILPDKSSEFGNAVAKFKGKGTLLITEKPGLAKIGSAINFIIKDQKIKFELNKTSASKAGLKVNSQLETLAISIIE